MGMRVFGRVVMMGGRKEMECGIGEGMGGVNARDSLFVWTGGLSMVWRGEGGGEDRMGGCGLRG